MNSQSTHPPLNIHQLQHIETPRLIIRPIQTGDEIALNQAINRSLPVLQPWFPWANHPSLEATTTFVNHGCAGWQSGHASQFPMAVILKETQTFIAACRFNEHSQPILPMYEIGYWIDTQYSGQGYISESVNALTRYALKALQAQRVQIRMMASNHKSIAVARRCGFTYEATLKNERLNSQAESVDGIIYACCLLQDLPALAATWIQHRKKVFSHNNLSSVHPSSHPRKQPPLATERLKLTPPTKHNVDALYTAFLASVKEVGITWPIVIPQLTKIQTFQYLAKFIAASQDMLLHNHLAYLIWHKDMNTMLGMIEMEIPDWSIKSFSLNYWIDSRYTCQGYVSEAVAGVIQYASNQLQAQRICLNISTTNSASLKVAQKLNFTLEGTLKNRFRNFITGEVSDGQLYAMTDFKQLNHF